jgi:hypothetical protein
VVLCSCQAYCYCLTYDNLLESLIPHHSPASPIARDTIKKFSVIQTLRYFIYPLHILIHLIHCKEMNKLLVQVQHNTITSGNEFPYVKLTSLITVPMPRNFKHLVINMLSDLLTYRGFKFFRFSVIIFRGGGREIKWPIGLFLHGTY